MVRWHHDHPRYHHPLGIVPSSYKNITRQPPYVISRREGYASLAASSSSSSSSLLTAEEVKALILPFLDPTDIPMANNIITAAFEKQIQYQGANAPEGGVVGINPLVVCNTFLIQLAKSDDTAILDKAFAYLGRMRSIEELRHCPSLPARNELIRGKKKLAQ